MALECSVLGTLGVSALYSGVVLAGMGLVNEAWLVLIQNASHICEGNLGSIPCTPEFGLMLGDSWGGGCHCLFQMGDMREPPEYGLQILLLTKGRDISGEFQAWGRKDT